jgi:hypothetical protein
VSRVEEGERREFICEVYLLRRCDAVALIAPSYHTSTLLCTINWKSQCRRPKDVPLTFLALYSMDHESGKTTPHRGLGTL